MSLKFRGMQYLITMLKKTIHSSLKDCLSSDVSALKSFLSAADDFFPPLIEYTKTFVVPCFPPHYKIYENIKEVCIKIIHDLLIENHI